MVRTDTASSLNCCDIALITDTNPYLLSLYQYLVLMKGSCQISRLYLIFHLTLAAQAINNCLEEARIIMVVLSLAAGGICMSWKRSQFLLLEMIIGASRKLRAWSLKGANARGMQDVYGCMYSICRSTATCARTPLPEQSCWGWKKKILLSSQWFKLGRLLKQRAGLEDLFLS